MNNTTEVDEIALKITKRVLSYIRDELPAFLLNNYPVIIDHNQAWEKTLQIKRLDLSKAEQLFNSSCYMKDVSILNVCTGVFLRLSSNSLDLSPRMCQVPLGKNRREMFSCNVGSFKRIKATR